MARPPTRLARRADRPKLLLASGILLFSSVCACAAENAQKLFDNGRAAFDRGDYAAALASFESAADAGLNGPAVHFNIGVAAFRSGNYERAESAFTETARTPTMTALAHYNLGLVALKRGNSSGARRWFERVRDEAADERLVSLATERLAGLPAPPERNWVGYASLGAGYDDNVALVASSEVFGVSGIDDAYAEVQLAASGPLDRDWQVDAGLVYLDYQDLDEFDQLSAQAGARYGLDSGAWRNEAAAQFSYGAFDGEGFENRRMVALQSSRSLAGDWRLRLFYRFSDIDGMNDFVGVSGTSHEAGGRAGWAAGPIQASVEYRFESSDHDDENLSATRQQIALAAQRKLTENWTIFGDATLRNSRYDVDENGEETLTELGVSIARSFSEQWRIVLRYIYTSNDADRAEFDYDRHRMGASFEALF